MGRGSLPLVSFSFWILRFPGLEIKAIESPAHAHGGLLPGHLHETPANVRVCVSFLLPRHRKGHAAGW